MQSSKVLQRCWIVLFIIKQEEEDRRVKMAVFNITGSDYYYSSADVSGQFKLFGADKH